MSIDRTRLSVSFLIKRLHTQSIELGQHQFPGNHPGPLKWLNVIEGLLDTAKNLLEQSVSQSTTESLSSIHDAAHLANTAYDCFRLFDGADVEDLPYSTIAPLQRWCDELNISFETLFRAELVANYEVRPFHDRNFREIRNPSDSLTKAIDDIKWPIVRITVPSRDFATLPHFAIVAHELGHILYSQMNWDGNEIEGELVKIRDELYANIAIRLKVTTLSSEAKTVFKEILSRWIEELAADAFAFYLTGPAIFFALSDFLQLLVGSYGMSKSHPANDLRRAILFEQLEKEGGESQKSFADIFLENTGEQLTIDFNSALLKETPDSDTIFKDMLKTSKIEAAVMAELHQSMKIFVSVIYRNVAGHIKGQANSSIYTTTKYEKDLKAHLEPMLGAIPPIEIGDTLETKAPTEFATILNVGWATMLTKLPNLKVAVSNELDDAEKLEKFHDLLLKSIELSEARRVWENV